MQILIIAPSTSMLPSVPFAVQQIVNSGANLHLEQGEVTANRLVELSQRLRAEVVVIMSDGDDDGLLMSDGRITHYDLAPVLRQMGTKLLKLSACRSVMVANAIEQACDVDVIAAITDVIDDQAARFDVNFINFLLMHGDYHRAYRDSLPGGSLEYVYLGHRTVSQDWREPFRQLRADVDEIKQMLQKDGLGSMSWSIWVGGILSALLFAVALLSSWGML